MISLSEYDTGRLVKMLAALKDPPGKDTREREFKRKALQMERKLEKKLEEARRRRHEKDTGDGGEAD